MFLHFTLLSVFIIITIQYRFFSTSLPSSYCSPPAAQQKNAFRSFLYTWRRTRSLNICTQRWNLRCGIDLHKILSQLQQIILKNIIQIFRQVVHISFFSYIRFIYFSQFTSFIDCFHAIYGKRQQLWGNENLNIAYIKNANPVLVCLTVHIDDVRQVLVSDRLFNNNNAQAAKKINTEN